MKFSPDLITILFSAIIGGNDDDGAFVLSLNPLNNDIYVGGATKSSDLQGNKTGVINASLVGGIDGFLTVFNNSGVIQKQHTSEHHKLILCMVFSLIRRISIHHGHQFGFMDCQECSVQ